MARLAWTVAGVALVLAALLGWRYSSARQEAAEARRFAEAEKLKAQGLIVVEQQSRAKAEKLAGELQGKNKVLEAEVERVSKLIPGTKVSASGQLVTENGTVVNALTRPMRPCPACPPCTPRSSPRWVPHRLRAPLSVLEPGGEPIAARGETWLRLAGIDESPGTESAAESGVGRPSANEVRSGPVVVRSALRRAAERGVPRGGTSKDAAPAEECVLANGDTTNVVVDLVTLETKAGNKVIVGTATVNRLTPEPPTPLVTAKFEQDASKLVDSTQRCPQVKGRGWGLGVYGSAWDGGQTVGPVLALPTLRAFGHSLEAAFTVGVAPKFSVGATALARY